MVIKVLGSGCASCVKLEKNVKEALKILSVTEEVLKVTDFSEIMAYGVMSTPALVVNEKVLFSGRVPDQKALVEMLSKTLK
ncbi:MAG TPA: thioredoxin family protein [Acholeplasma sp.]|nr:thioredoxin family protein [Acholeplasma sp.]